MWQTPAELHAALNGLPVVILTHRAHRLTSTSRALRLGVILFWVASPAIAACGAGAVRSPIVPFAQARSDTVPTTPDTVIVRLHEILTAEGLQLRWTSTVEGYIETRWFNAVTGRSESANSLATEVTVRLRFWADLIRSSQTVVVGEAVFRRVLDPSLPARETEAPVPPGHPGDEILQRVMDALGSHGGD